MAAVAERPGFIEAFGNITKKVDCGVYLPSKTLFKVASLVETFEHLGPRVLLIASKTATIFGTALRSLSFMYMFHIVGKTAVSIYKYAVTSETGYRAQEKLLEALHDIFDVIKSTGYLLDLLNAVSVIGLSTLAQATTGIVIGSASIIIDSIELFRSCKTLFWDNWSNTDQLSVEKKRLAAINIVKNVTGIAIAIIALSNIYVGAALCAAKAVIAARHLLILELFNIFTVWTNMMYKEMHPEDATVVAAAPVSRDRLERDEIEARTRAHNAKAALAEEELRRLQAQPA